MAMCNFTGWLAGAQALKSNWSKTEHREREINKFIGKEKGTNTFSQNPFNNQNRGKHEDLLWDPFVDELAHLHPWGFVPVKHLRIAQHFNEKANNSLQITCYVPALHTYYQQTAYS